MRAVKGTRTPASASAKVARSHSFGSVVIMKRQIRSSPAASSRLCSCSGTSGSRVTSRPSRRSRSPGHMRPFDHICDLSERLPRLPRRCRSTSTSAWSASRTSRSSSGTETTPTVRTAAPRTCASSSPCSRLTAPPSSRASAEAAAVAAGAVAAATDALARADELAAFAASVAGCTRCPLAAGRTQVVFGSGDPAADLMFVGEAPGFHEDQQGVPFVGQAGKLLERLLAGIGLERREVYIANVIKCRPPGNRDPQPEEIEACESYLFRQVELIQPRVIATLGNFATKLLSGKPTGITRVHGQEQETTLGGRRVLLYPLYHPPAPPYTPRMLDVLRSDFARLPELLGRETPPPEPIYAPPVVAEPAVQLGLF